MFGTSAVPDRCGTDRPDPASKVASPSGASASDSHATTWARPGAQAMAGCGCIKVLIAHSDPLISAGLFATLRERRDFKVAVCDPESSVSHSID